jgi:hypothetical protein
VRENLILAKAKYYYNKKIKPYNFDKEDYICRGYCYLLMMMLNEWVFDASG